jgi:DNA-binding transcriptional LysR family regulator
MIASMPHTLSAGDLQVILALVRGRTLAQAAALSGLDGSTVFRTLQRLERGLGRNLFERTRSGYMANELARELAAHAEQLESALEAARSAATATEAQVAGTVRITTTDTVLHGLVAPALRALVACHPLLQYELHTGNELASLTRRDADVAVRATRRPPPHLVGRCVGTLRVAIYARSGRGAPSLDEVLAGAVDWIAPDDALPEHPSVLWRKRHLPRVQPRFRVNSILSVVECVALGLGVGIVPLFLGDARRDVRRLSEPLAECETDLWVLTHTESRHLRRVSAVYGHLAQTLTLP